MGSIQVSEQVGRTEDVSDSDRFFEYEKQTRTRRLFSQGQLFMFSFMYMTTWSAVGSNMYFALYNGGPAAWFFGYFIAVIGVFLQCASLGEMASVQPIAGAQYYWTYALAPRSMKRFLAWIQGWMTWAGYVALLASVFNANTVFLEGAIIINDPDYEAGGWKTTLVIVANLAFCVLVNVYAFRLVPWFEVLTGILSVIMFVVYIVVIWVMSPRNSSNIFLATNVSSGWGDYFTAANVGMLSNIYLFVGFESVIHLGEETRDAKHNVPRAMFWSIFTGAALGFVTLFTLMICMPDIEILLNATSPFVTIIQVATRSNWAATALVGTNIVMCVSCNMTSVASVSRITWAWARDGGLPIWFGHVDGKHRVPARSVMLTFILVSLLSLLHVVGATYVAFGAIVSLTLLALYASYAILLSCMLYARWVGNFRLGEWNLGRFGPYINAFALVYTCWIMVFLPFPSTLPVTGSNLNYCGPVFGLVLVGAISMWFIRARKTWDGPNQTIVDMVLRDS